MRRQHACRGPASRSAVAARSIAVQRSRCVALIGLTWFAIGGAATTAYADLKLCNYTASRVGVAVGYKDKDGWVTEGWWNVLSNACETLFTGELKARFYYVHAVDYDRGGEWAGKDLMCVGDKSFTIKGVDSCAERGYKRTGFYEVDTGEAKEFTIRLTDPGDNGAKTQ